MSPGAHALVSTQSIPGALGMQSDKTISLGFNCMSSFDGPPAREPQIVVFLLTNHESYASIEFSLVYKLRGLGEGY